MSAKTVVYRFLASMRPVLARRCSPSEIVDALLDRTLAVMGADHGVLVTSENDATKTRTRSSNGKTLSSNAVAALVGLATRTLERRAPQLAATVVAAPLLLQGEALGAFAIEKPFPTADDAEALEAIAAFASTTLHLCHELTKTTRALEDERRAHGRTVQKLEKTKVTARLPRFGKLVGDSEPMTSLKRRLAKLCDSHEPVLVRGESGTGKDLVAQLLHEAGPRASGPYVAINIAAYTDSLLESELFGCKKGAFTGATEDRIGAFEAANGGTLFLDEIADASPAIQVKLLRVLQNKELRRVGSTKVVPLDVRIVSATNKDLEALVAEGKFREELYYRLKVIKVVVPPLRDRGKGDLRALLRHFLEKIARDNKTAPRTLSPEALAAIEAHSWPGNVRELENVLRSAVAEQNDPIRSEDLELDEIVGSAAVPSCEAVEPVTEDAVVPTSDSSVVKTAASASSDTRRVLLEVLEATSWNLSALGRALGVSRTTVYALIETFGIPLPAGGRFRRPVHRRQSA